MGHSGIDQREQARAVYCVRRGGIRDMEEDMRTVFELLQSLNVGEAAALFVSLGVRMRDQ